MKITGAESFILDIPIGREIVDSMQSVTSLEFVGLRVSTEEGITGTGYTVTVGYGGSVIKEVLDSLFINELTGIDPFNVRQIWQQLYFGKAHWIGRAGATTMAQAAVDIALWDIIAKSVGKPLWQALGGARDADIPIYNTHAGWLNHSVAQLQDECSRLLDDGYTALKMKVGLTDTYEDLRRVEAVRNAIPDSVSLMVDANQKWDLAQAKLAMKLFDHLDLSWVEEPLHPDDIKAHRLLHEAASLPIALGEHVYTMQAFRDYIDQSAVDVVQVDVCRVGGVTPWMDVAALANAANLRVCPHAGDLMQVHQHMVRAIPNQWLLEVIPIWDDSPFAEPVRLTGGECLTPTAPGASTDFTQQAFVKYRVA